MKIRLACAGWMCPCGPYVALSWTTEVYRWHQPTKLLFMTFKQLFITKSKNFSLTSYLRITELVRLKEISKLNSFQFCFQVISPIFNAEEESLPSPPPSPLTDSKLDDRVRAKKNLITFFSHFLNIICKFNYESVSA